MDTGMTKACGFLASCALALSPLSALAKGSIDNPSVVSISPDGNDVDVSGTVGVSGQVEIKNDSGNAIAVDTMKSDRTPFVFHDFNTTSPGTQTSSSSFQVPDGERLVIEHISAWVRVASTDYVVDLSMYGTTNDVQWTEFPIATERPESEDEHDYFVSENLRLYADQNTTVEFLATVAGVELEKSILADVTISGYTIPMDEPSLDP